MSEELGMMRTVLADAWALYESADPGDRLALGIKVLDIASKVLKAEQDAGKQTLSSTDMMRVAESMLPHVQEVLDKHARDPLAAMRELAEKLSNASSAHKQ